MRNTKLFQTLLFSLILEAGLTLAASADESMKKLDHNPAATAIEGNRYETTMPADTLDLADRMSMAINALTQAWFPEEKWALGFKVDFSRRPPALLINHTTDAYLNIPPKFIEALALCRLGSGSNQNIDVDKNILEAQLRFLGDDGLTYAPDDTLDKQYPRDNPRPGAYAEIWGEGRMLIALSILAQIDEDLRWVEIGKRKIDRLLELSREKEDFRYFSTGRFYPGDVTPLDAPEPTAKIYHYMYNNSMDFNFKLTIAYSMGAVGHGSALFYRVTGYAPALELSRGLARWAMKRLFDNPDGRWDMYHFHHSLYALIAMCEYGIAAKDREILERIDACYRWVREMGDPLIGYYPECMPGSKSYLQREGNTVEICEVTDMIWLALQLTQAGLGNYWGDVDRWTRNMLAEGQFMDLGRLDQLSDSFFETEPSHQPYEDTNNILQRSQGSFLGWMRANDGLCLISNAQGEKKLQSKAIMHCCTANGARTLYCIWDSIITKTDHEIYVNLLLNRYSPWLDMHSYLPAEGKAVLHIKDAETVNVRLPEWCDPKSVIVHLNKRVIHAAVKEKILILSLLKPKDEIQIEFDVPQKVIFRVIGEIPYKLTLRGANVVKIDPPGIAYPLFHNQPTGTLSKKMGFVPKLYHLTW